MPTYEIEVPVIVKIITHNRGRVAAVTDVRVLEVERDDSGVWKNGADDPLDYDKEVKLHDGRTLSEAEYAYSLAAEYIERMANRK